MALISVEILSGSLADSLRIPCGFPADSLRILSGDVFLSLSICKIEQGILVKLAGILKGFSWIQLYCNLLGRNIYRIFPVIMMADASGARGVESDDV